MKTKLLPVLAKYKIEAPEIMTIKNLPSAINFVYLINTKRGKFVLKRYKKVKPPYLIDLHKCIIKLIMNNAPIPRIFKNKEGNYLTELNEQYYDLSQYVKHIDLSDQITISHQDLVLAGKTLAKLQETLKKSAIESTIKRLDFKEIAKHTLNSIEDFLLDHEAILADAKNQRDKHKLSVLREIINDTNNFRKKGIYEFSDFLSQPYVPTHGDFSMVNILIKPDRSMVFVTDWDGLSLRPAVWDLQTALSLFSLTNFGNAYFMKPDFDKIKFFLKGYLTSAKITHEQLSLLPAVVKYNFAVYWLSYTLPAMLNRDFRLLNLIPEKKQEALYWLQGFHEYESFIANIAAKL